MSTLPPPPAPPPPPEFRTYAPGAGPEAAKTAVEALQLLFSSIPGDYWIAGGAVRDLCLYAETKSDYDLFFPNQVDVDLAKRCLKEIDGNQLKLTTPSAYKFKTKLFGKIDVVRRTFSGPTACIRQFDFTVAAAAVDRSGTFYCHPRFFQDLADRALVINQLPFPLSTMRRLQKYVRKGYHICNGGILEIARAIQKADLEGEQVFYVD